MDILELKKFIQDNPKLVKMRESLAYPGLFVLKYSKAVFYDNLWNDYLEHCRGTIVDKDFNIIAYPFQKIYNYDIESRAPKLPDQTPVTAFRKINGFMASVTWYNGDILVSTTGSTDSDFVTLAKETMIQHMPWNDWQLAFASRDMHDMTFMFEVCHPHDPHIIPEKSGMYILGYRENIWQSAVGHNPDVLADLAKMFKCHVPEHITVTIGDLKQLVKTCRHEGYVAYTKDGQCIKIKSPYYLTSKWVARNPRTDKLVNMQHDIKKNIDEEYYNLIDSIRANITEYTAMDEQARLAWVRDHLT